MSLIGALLLASTIAQDVENPRSASLNGDYLVVIRRMAILGDFERVTREEYSRRQDEVWEAEEEPKQPAPIRGAIYRLWPGDYRELTGEFTFEPGEAWEHVLVSNDGFVVSHGPVVCGPAANLLTIRAANGEVVRAMRVREAVTINDHQWLCSGSETDVRFALEERTLRMTMRVDPDDATSVARYHTVDIDLETGKVPAPDRDHCPAATLVIPEAHDAVGQLLLDRAITRVQPEYPEVARKARISGIVRVRVVVGSDGRLESAMITKPLPFGCDQSVQAAIAQWEFSPGEPVTGEIAFRFEIVRPPRLVTMSCH